VSCQHYENGYYNAYRHLAEEDLDVVLHLGDYIYENPQSRNKPRRHVGGEPTDLAGYRVRHALYKTDRDLQAAHANHPFVPAWDDHEVENDYAGRHPVKGGDPAAFLRRRAAAYRAYWEHMPLRRPPRGATVALYRRLRSGDLVELNLLDTRQYRDDQPCDEGGPGGGRVVVCPERVDPRRTILGDTQRRWLLRGLDRSQARWNVLAQQVVMAERDLHPGEGRSWWSDAWDGHAADRDRILRFLWERQPANPVVLTGDIHSFSVNDLRLPGSRPRRSGGGDRAGRDLDQLRRKQPQGQRLSQAPGRQPAHLLLRESPARLHPLHRDPPALVRGPAGGRLHRAAGRRRPHAGVVRGRGRPPRRRAGVNAREHR
jgi:alkaline phosphatase D